MNDPTFIYNDLTLYNESLALPPSIMSLSVQSDSLESGSRILLCGKLDASTVPQLEKAVDTLMDEDETRVIIINLGGLEFISSAGLGVLLVALKKIRGLDGHLFITEPSPTIYNVFKMTGLTRVFIIYLEEREALSAIRMMQQNAEFSN